MADRTIHGFTVGGQVIVRYERAGKWFVEEPLQREVRRPVGVREAAQLADRARLGLSGGSRFDALVRAQPGRDTEWKRG